MGSSPMFPIIHSNSYAYVINHLNLIASKKFPKIKILNTRKNLSLVKSLHSVGCVSKFYLIKSSLKTLHKDHIYVSTPFYKNTSFFKSVRVVSTPSRKHSISLNGLRLAQNSLGSSIMILSTPYGLITHKKAIELRSGGLILCMVH